MFLSDFCDALNKNSHLFPPKRRDFATIRSKSLVVHCEALDRELLNDTRGPLAKLNGPFGVNLVTNGNDG